MTDFFVPHVAPMWGYEYLIHGDGWSPHEILEVRRAGPAMPTVTMPGRTFVIRDCLREELTTQFPKVSLSNVVLTKVVDVPWQDWDIHADFYPPGYDESCYCDTLMFYETLPHSPSATEGLGQLWEVQMPVDANSRVERIALAKYNLFISLSSWGGLDFFSIAPAMVNVPIVTDRAREWVEQHAGKWFVFEQVFIE